MAAKVYRCQVCGEDLIIDNFSQEAVCKFCGQKHTWQFKKGSGFTWLPETISGYRYQKPAAEETATGDRSPGQDAAKGGEGQNNDWWHELQKEKGSPGESPAGGNQGAPGNSGRRGNANNGLTIGLVMMAIFVFSGILLFYIFNAAISAGSKKDEGGQDIIYSSEDTGEVIAAEEEEMPLLPQSGLWLALMDVLYDGLSDEELAAELAKIKYLGIDRTKDAFTVGFSTEDYSVNPDGFDAAVTTFEFDRNLSYSAKEFICFPGLTRLDVGFSGLEDGCLMELAELKSLSCRYEIAEIAAMVNPMQILELRLERIKTLDELAKFRNLQILYIYRGDMTDLNKLAGLANLISLELDNCKAVSDFSGLGSLTKLQSLKLYCDELKDISFIDNMADLQILSIRDSKIISLEPVRGHEQMTYLAVKDNSDVMDYSSVATLTNLETLEFAKYHSQSMPDLGSLQNLTQLSVSRVDDISFLRKLPNIQKLILSSANITDTGAIAGLQNLQELKLSGIYGDFSSLGFLTGMPSLKKLDISGNQFYGNITEVFRIPDLEVLILNGSTFGMETGKVVPQPGLKSLYMNKVKFYKNIKVTYSGPVTMLDYDDVAFQDYAHFITNFENLEVLDLGSTQIYDLSFLENLKKLRKVNISDNYVTDLSVLMELDDLEEVWCGGNPAAAEAGFKPGVIVHH